MSYYNRFYPKQSLFARWKEFKIEAKLKGLEVSPTFGDEQPRPNWLIYVTNLETKETITFDFYGSIIDQREQKKKLSINDLIYCFYLLLSDAISGEMDVDDFQNEFGYTSVKECLRVHRACKDQLHKANIILNGYDLYDTINDLQEAHPDAM